MSLKTLVMVISLQMAINSVLIATGIALAGGKISRAMGRRAAINAAALQGLNLGGGIQRGNANFGGNLNSNVDLNMNANLAGAGGFGAGAGANMAGMSGMGGGDALGALIGASLMNGSSNSANMNVNRSTNFDVNINGGLNGYSGLALIGNGQTIPISTININNRPVAIGGTLGITGANNNNMNSMSMTSSSMNSSSIDMSGSSSMAGMDMSNSAAKVTFENLQLTPDGIPGSAVIAP